VARRDPPRRRDDVRQDGAAAHGWLLLAGARWAVVGPRAGANRTGRCARRGESELAGGGLVAS
jgi:hypothetical protein